LDTHSVMHPPTGRHVRESDGHFIYPATRSPLSRNLVANMREMDGHLLTGYLLTGHLLTGLLQTSSWQKPRCKPCQNLGITDQTLMWKLSALWKEKVTKARVIIERLASLFCFVVKPTMLYGAQVWSQNTINSITIGSLLGFWTNHHLSNCKTSCVSTYSE